MSVEEIRNIVNSYLPDPYTRKICLEIFLETIIKANSVSSASWGITVNPNEEQAIRLTVGMIYVCNIYPDGLTLTLYAPDQEVSPLRSFLTEENIGALNNIKNHKPDPEPNAPHFRSLPEAVWCWFKATDIEKVYPIVRDSYNKTIAISSRSVANPAVQRVHKADVIHYLNEEFPNIAPLPQPTYPSYAEKTKKKKGKFAFYFDDPYIVNALKEIEKRDQEIYNRDL